ncbi:MAG: amidohydrolase family protein [Defluviitaleaceae bacterium]|nr:amidohydrolase family protein [Defluviitaleaceae bacterium]
MSAEKTFAIKGHLIRNTDPGSLEVLRDSWAICEGGVVAGVYPVLPEKYAGIDVTDYGDRLIIPGLTDIHLHAPQYAFRGLGMDLELLEWLETYAFPEESKYADLDYAEKAYEIFADDLVASVSTRFCVYGTVHVEATVRLMQMMEDRGLHALVGKVNMDRNSPGVLRESSAEQSLADTRAWAEECGKFRNVRPILTPRFIPTCSDELMHGLGRIRKETGMALQSHLSENPAEVAWVIRLCPESKGYVDAYDSFGVLDGGRVVMAHCVYNDFQELETLKTKGVYLAHCPTSNSNLSSGIAPVRMWLDLGLNCGIGSDIAGGHSLSLFHTMAHAIQTSKLRRRILDGSLAPLTVPEVFYMATRGGGSLFGKVGDLSEGYAFDAVVLDDSRMLSPFPLSQMQRLERMIYQVGPDGNYVHAKYIGGKLVYSADKIR